MLFCVCVYVYVYVYVLLLLHYTKTLGKQEMSRGAHERASIGKKRLIRGLASGGGGEGEDGLSI